MHYERVYVLDVLFVAEHIALYYIRFEVEGKRGRVQVVNLALVVVVRRIVRIGDDIIGYGSFVFR